MSQTYNRLQKKYNTVDATAKDSCFFFAVVDSKGKRVMELDHIMMKNISKSTSALN